MTETPAPRPLVVAAHGTTSAAGRAVVEECAARAGEILGVPASVGYVDVCEPALVDVLRERALPVVVPLFLATGYHVRYDVPAAIEQSPGSIVTRALGSADAVVEALVGRLRDLVDSSRASSQHPDGIVLASAGSTQAAARAEVAEVARLLTERTRAPVRVAYLSGLGPDIKTACDAHRLLGLSRLAVVAHLLAPGVFLDRARRLGAEAGVIGVTDALGTHPAMSALVARRYQAAVAGHPPQVRLRSRLSSSPDVPQQNTPVGIS